MVAHLDVDDAGFAGVGTLAETEAFAQIDDGHDGAAQVDDALDKSGGAGYAGDFGQLDDALDARDIEAVVLSGERKDDNLFLSGTGGDIGHDGSFPSTGVR